MSHFEVMSIGSAGVSGFTWSSDDGGKNWESSGPLDDEQASFDEVRVTGKPIGLRAYLSQDEKDPDSLILQQIGI